MLSRVLSSPRAIAVNVEIMRAFVKLPQAIAANAELAKRLAVVETKLAQHRAEFGKTTTDTYMALPEIENICEANNTLKHSQFYTLKELGSLQIHGIIPGL